MTENETTLHVHLADEIKHAERDSHNNPKGEDLIKQLERLNKLMPNDSWHNVSRMVEKVKELHEAGRGDRRDDYYRAPFTDAVSEIGRAISNHIGQLATLQAEIQMMAAKMDVTDSRLNAIEDQRKDLTPMELMRIELEETKVEAQRGVSMEQAKAAREEAQRIKMETQCGSKTAGDANGFGRYDCDKKAKVIINGVKLCGIHAQPEIRDAKSRIDYLSYSGYGYGRKFDPKLAEENAVEIEVYNIQTIEPIKKAIKDAKNGAIITVEFPSDEEATAMAEKRVKEQRAERKKQESRSS